MITVRELRAWLDEYDDDDVVVLEKDAEGNEHSPLAGHGDAIYAPDTTWSGKVYIRELTPELHGFTEDDLYHGNDGHPALVLHPVN